MAIKTISFQKLMLSWVAAGLFCALSTPLHAEPPRDYATEDYRKLTWILSDIKVGEPKEINRVPLFDNAPSLRLKPGDKIIKGHRWYQSFKSGAGRFLEKESYFVLSNGKYDELEQVHGQGDKLLLEAGYYSLFFDWNVTLKAATHLRTLKNDYLSESITPKALAKLRDALRKDFPETLRDAGKIKNFKPHLEGEGKTRRAIFQGLGFDRHYNVLFKYQIEIGQDIYVRHRQPLIIGPRRIEREEFEGDKNIDSPFPIINRGFGYQPTAEEAAIARVAYDRMIAFQNVVNKFLVTPRSDRSELNY